MTNQIVWTAGQKDRLLGKVDGKIAFSLRSPNSASHHVELASRKRTRFTRTWQAEGWYQLNEYENDISKAVEAAKEEAERIAVVNAEQAVVSAKNKADTAERTVTLLTFVS